MSDSTCLRRSLLANISGAESPPEYESLALEVSPHLEPPEVPPLDYDAVMSSGSQSSRTANQELQHGGSLMG